MQKKRSETKTNFCQKIFMKDKEWKNMFNNILALLSNPGVAIRNKSAMET